MERPVDIEALLNSKDGKTTIQTEGHQWLTFDGPYEGAHPWLQITTQNGMVGPADPTGAPPPGASTQAPPIWLSPTPTKFSTKGGSLPREAVLDDDAWILAAGFAELQRQQQLSEDGGPGDSLAGAPGDYLFIDYHYEQEALGRLSFEAKVDGAFWSSLNVWTESKPGGLTDAHAYGVGRTCIELPPGRSAEDIEALRAVAAGDAPGVLKRARWFRYDDEFTLKEMGAYSSSDVVMPGAIVPLP